MDKTFDQWNIIKKAVNKNPKYNYIKERQIWYVNL